MLESGRSKGGGGEIAPEFWSGTVGVSCYASVPQVLNLTMFL